MRKEEKEERLGKKELGERERTPRAEAKAVVEPRAMPDHLWCATDALELGTLNGYVPRQWGRRRPPNAVVARGPDIGRVLVRHLEEGIRASTPAPEGQGERSVQPGGGRRIPAAATTAKQHFGNCSTRTVDVLELGVPSAMDASGRRAEGG